MEPNMDAGLLALACSGSFHYLESFLDGKPAAYAIGSSARQPPDLYAVTIGGNTLLHMVAASHGDSEDLLNKASLVYSKAHGLLFVQNSQGDTPLHCAARAGNIPMMSRFIDLANGQGINNAKGLLETQNKLKETALHEAVRFGSDDMVNLLMTHDPELATLPEEGTSPLYLAILMESKIIAKTLYELSGGHLSYSGPNGQNALHAAVQRSQDLTKMLLEWNNGLTLRVDANGSTPLHFAVVAILRQIKRDSQSICSQVLKANPDALYLPDHNGSFPTHVASSTGATWVIDDFLMKSPSCAGLLDARGRTFLHVAVDEMNTRIVDYACRKISLSWILNVQDKDGNTALHLAVRKRSLRLFCSLFSNRQVNLDLPNEKGETPLDTACNNIPGGLYYRQNDDAMMKTTLKCVGAKMGVSGFTQKNNVEKSGQDEIRRMNQVKEATQSLCIGSVLIATVTFGATFAVPGGYRDDDHTNPGTPTLATTNTFSVFILATAMAFTFSVMATISLMSSGCPMIHLQTREVNLQNAYFCMMNSISFLAASFSIGTFVILSPVLPLTALLVYGMSCVILDYYSLVANRKNLLFMTVCKRNGIRYGISWALPVAAGQLVIFIIFQLCPMIFILIDTDNAGHKVEPPAQAPIPFA